MKKYCGSYQSCPCDWPADAVIDDLVNLISNADLVPINLFLEGIAIDAKHPGRLHLIAVIDTKGQFDQRFFNLFQNDFMEAVEFDLGFLLLLKQNFQLAADEFLQANGLEIGNEKIIRAVVRSRWSHCRFQPPLNFQEK